MKQIVISLSLLMILFTAGTLNAGFISKKLDTIVALLTQCSENVSSEQWEKSDQLALRAKEEWDGFQVYLSVTMRHSELDLAEELMVRAMASLTLRDRAQFQSENAALIWMLGHIRDIERLSIKNVL